MKLSICATSTSRPLSRPSRRRAASTMSTATGQGRPILGLQRDREDVPEHDAVADGEVDPAGHHRDHRRQRQHRDDRLVAEDRAEVEHRREGVRQQDREEDDEQRRQDQQAVDREQPRDASGRAAGARSSAAGRLERGRLDGLHAASARAARRRRSRARRRAMRASIESASPASSRDDPAAAEDQGAVADRRDLLEVGRDQRGPRAPACERRGEQAVDLGLGADVDAGRRILEHQHRAGPIRSQRADRPPSAGCRRTASRSAASGSFGRQADACARARAASRALRRRPSASAKQAAAGGARD